MIKFIASGDQHLDDLIWRRHRNITGDAALAFRQLVQAAIDLKVPLVLVGDLFDTTDPPSHLVRLVREEFERCAQAGIEVFAMQGNHDKRPNEPWYTAISSNVRHIGDGEQHLIGGIRCIGLDYAVKDVICEQLSGLRDRIDNGIPAPQILFLHQACRQALRFEGAWNCDLDWVHPSIPLVVMGDIHAQHNFELAGGGKALYTGATHPRSLDEICGKGFVAVHDDLTVERLPLAGRFFGKVVWAEPAEVNLELVLADLRSVGAHPLPPVLWLRYSPECMADAQRLAEEVQRLRVETIIVDEPLSAREDGKPVEVDTSDLPSVPKLLASLLNPDQDAFAYQLALDLMDPTADTAQLIRDARDRYLGVTQQRAAG